MFDVVLFDFDGVLCRDRFYTRLRTYSPPAHEFVETRVWRPGSDIPDRWMRGELSSDDVNRFISESTGVDFDLINRAFLEGVAEMRVDVRLLVLARTLATRGIGVGLVTDNMDVFNRVTIQRHALNDVFPAIVNSCDYGCLKHEQDGRLFDVAMARLGREGRYDTALLVDDSPTNRAAFARKGGHVFAYDGYGTFRQWVDSWLDP